MFFRKAAPQTEGRNNTHLLIKTGPDGALEPPGGEVKKVKKLRKVKKLLKTNRFPRKFTYPGS